MDRALPDKLSEPAPAPTVEPAAEAAESDDEQTHMLSSLAAVAAMSGKGRGTLASLSGHERPSQPARSFSPAPFRPSSAPPPGDKPLWYVDLGGAETVEMTIEQLIIARRSGKLGEGALVWRAGMPRWRPVGELIPASSAGRPTPTPPPPAPPPPTPPVHSSALLPPPPPPPIAAPSASRRQSDPPAAFGSYERPLATLEFALEKPTFAAAREPSKVSPPPPPPSKERRASEPPRAPTPIPQRLATPIPLRTPPPIPQPATWSSPSSVVAPLPTPAARSGLSTAPVTLPPANPDHTDLFGEGPRWRTVSLALLLCVGASGSGAFLVRTVRGHHQPLALASSSAPAVAASAGASTSAPVARELHAATPAEPAPKVVDLSSLSIEHAAPRAQPRAAVATPARASEPSTDSNASEQAEPAAQTAPSATPKPKNSDLPAAAHANPYTSGSAEDSSAKKPVAPSDEPGL